MLCAISAYLCFGPRIHSHHKCTKCRPKILVWQTAFVINQVLAKNMSVNADSCYAQQLSTVETCRNKILYIIKYHWEFHNFSYKQLCLESKNLRSTAEKLLVHDGTWPWQLRNSTGSCISMACPNGVGGFMTHIWPCNIIRLYLHIFNIFCYHMNWRWIDDYYYVPII